MTFYAISLKASGTNLKSSYPIEIAYTNGTFQRTLFIRPDKTWTHWDEDQEKKNRISKDFIQQYGFELKDVCDIVNHDLAGKEVLVNNISHMLFMQTLFETSKLQSSFRIQVIETPILYEKNTTLADAIHLWEWVTQKLAISYV